MDAAVPARHGCVVLALVDGELTGKILDIRIGQLLPANTHYSPILLYKVGRFVIERVVVSSVRFHQPLPNHQKIIMFFTVNTMFQSQIPTKWDEAVVK